MNLRNPDMNFSAFRIVSLIGGRNEPSTYFICASVKYVCTVMNGVHMQRSQESLLHG